MKITLYGAASNSIDRVYIDKVEELGYALAENGCTMVYGGGSTGLMGAAARGMKRGNGNVIGVVPRFMHDFEPIYDECTELIHTDTMAERKTLMEDLAEAFIIVPGGIGTFDELFQILTLKVLKQLDKPIVLYNINGFWDNMLSVLGVDMFKGFISKDVVDGFTICETPESVMQALLPKGE
ncbi:MAG: TIGR00730 family Rossman fold protein [Clostridia bacterium]|nr:TIGR00730 family Rossman fold protein [Clostridia bacterium]